MTDTTTRTRYVLGFLFNDDGGYVVLIRKNRPDWMKGLLNGIGGKVEGNECIIDALVREYREEAGVTLQSIREFAVLEGPDYDVHCFMSFDTSEYLLARTLTDENVVKVSTRELRSFSCIHNLHWLIALALDKNHGKQFYAKVTYL